MEEAREGLQAALLQAKRQCIAIQRQVWERDKNDIAPGEDLYVRRFLYAVTVARQTPFFNGYRASHAPRSKSLTRIFMEQRYKRTRSLPPSLHNRERSVPRLTLTDSSDGVSTKVEFTETVEESTLKDLIKIDMEECAHLARKLPPTLGEWEHMQDVRLQVSGGITQKGAIFRMGEHLYGFDTVRDLSFQAADQVDKFFGRKPHGDLLYQSPYHFLHDYIEDYGQRFFKTSLSRSAYDLSEWSRQHMETPSIGSPLSLSEADFDSMETERKEDIEKVRRNPLVFAPLPGIHSAAEALPKLMTYSGEESRVMRWESISERGTHARRQYPRLPSVSYVTSSLIQLPTNSPTNYNDFGSKSRLQSYFSAHSLDSRMLKNTEALECNHHLVKDFYGGSDDDTTYLHSSADAQPTAPMLEPEICIKSTPSPRHSTAEYLLIDRELEDTRRARTPVSPYSEKSWSQQRATVSSIAEEMLEKGNIYTHMESRGLENTQTREEASEYRKDKDERIEVREHIYEPQYGESMQEGQEDTYKRCYNPYATDKPIAAFSEKNILNQPLTRYEWREVYNHSYDNDFPAKMQEQISDSHYSPYGVDRTQSAVTESAPPFKSVSQGATHEDLIREYEKGLKEDIGISDSETLLAQQSVDDSASDTTLVQDETLHYNLETLGVAAELEESHLRAHVASVPSVPYSDATESQRKEAELLLRDVHSTHKALQEEFDKYENAFCLKGKPQKETIYDTVAKGSKHVYDTAYGSAGDTKHTYDTVYNHRQDVHHAHGALVLSEPVQRPLAVSPPLYDEVADQRSQIELLHYAEADLSKHYEDDENIYEEIKDVPNAPTDKSLESDINSNIDSQRKAALHSTRATTKDASRQREDDFSRQTAHASPIQLEYGNEAKEKTYGRKINRSLGSEHQIIRRSGDEPKFSTVENRGLTETYENARPVPSPTFQRLQHQYTPEDVQTTKDNDLSWQSKTSREYEMKKDEEDSGAKDSPKGIFDKETALATVAIRRMSRRNQWTDDEDEDLKGYDFDKGRLIISSRSTSPRPFSSNSVQRPASTTRSSSSRSKESKESEQRRSHSHGYNERSYGKREFCRYQKKDPPHCAAVFDERTYLGLNPPRKDEQVCSPISTSSFEIRDTSGSRSSWRSEEQLTRSDEVGFVPLLKERSNMRESRRPYKPARDSPIRESTSPVKEPKLPPQQSSPVPPTSPATPTFRKGFVYEMARKYEEAHKDAFPKGKTFAKKTSGWRLQKQALVGNGAVPVIPSPRSVSQPPAGSTTVSVQEAVYAYERGSSPGLSHITSTSESAETREQHSAILRMVPIGSKDSENLDEVKITRWSSYRDDFSPNDKKSVVVKSSKGEQSASKESAAAPPIPPRSSPTTAAEAPKEAEPAGEKPVPLQRNGSGRRSWSVKTYEYKDFSRQKLKMPDIESLVHNGNLSHPEKFVGEESAVLRNWNPRSLVRALYEVSYEPRVETKRNRFVNMEGHVEIPSDETSTVAELERMWKQLYMRTKEGRLQIFVSHCADEAPAEEVVLSGVDVDANREERTLTIHGGREHIRMTLRVQSNVFDKWRHSLLSHAASSQIDAYVKPIPKTFQHLTERIVVLELGSCSIRGGVLTTEPSLPQSFFPAIAVRTDDGRIVVGEDAYAPEIRHHGEFARPIQATDPAVERYTMDHDVVKACVHKVVKDLNIKPSQYKVLLSIPQNIPIALIGQLLTLVLKEIGFQGAAITRQPSLILYAYDVTTGVVVDIGDRLNIVPVIDGYVVESAICSIPYGATQVREALRTTLCSNNKGLYSFQSPIEKLILRYVLEQTSYVPEDYAQEEKTSKEVYVSLDKFDPIPGMPTKFNIDNSRFLCTEGLFRPKKWGLDTKGLHQLVHEAVQMSPIDSRRTLYRNIYLAGGASLMPGLAEKLEQELAAIVPNSIHTQVHISPWRYNAAYLGAQIVASASTFSDSCVSLENLPTFLTQLQSSCF